MHIRIMVSVLIVLFLLHLARIISVIQWWLKIDVIYLFANLIVSTRYQNENAPFHLKSVQYYILWFTTAFGLESTGLVASIFTDIIVEQEGSLSIALPCCPK